MNFAAVLRKTRRMAAGLWFKGLAHLGQSEMVGACRVVRLQASALDQPTVARIEAAMSAIGEYDALTANVISSMFEIILVQPGSTARVIPETKMAIIGSDAVIGLSAKAFAGQLVFLATYARLLGSGEGSLASVNELECAARKAEISFLGKVPDTIDIRLRLLDEAARHDCD